MVGGGDEKGRIAPENRPGYKQGDGIKDGDPAVGCAFCTKSESRERERESEFRAGYSPFFISARILWSIRGRPPSPFLFSIDSSFGCSHPTRRTLDDAPIPIPGYIRRTR
jgi:hypothetical protein